MVEIGAEGLFHDIEMKVSSDLGLEVHNLQPVSHDHKQNEVLIGTDAVVRIAKKSPSHFDREAWVLGKFVEAGVPGPRVLGYQEKPQSFDQPVIVLSKVPGQTMTEAMKNGGDGEKYFESAGQLLRRIHAIPVEGFGSLDVTGGTARGKSPTWEVFWKHESREEELRTLLEKGFITEDELSTLQQVNILIKERPVSSASLLHGDYHKNNILVDKDGSDEISGVIDLCTAKAGDPLLDVATALVFQRKEPQYREAFLRGYGEFDRDALRLYIIAITGRRMISRLATGEVAKAEEYREYLRAILQEGFPQSQPA